jgi:hypothetical protein
LNLGETLKLTEMVFSAAMGKRRCIEVHHTTSSVPQDE